MFLTLSKLIDESIFMFITNKMLLRPVRRVSWLLIPLIGFLALCVLQLNTFVILILIEKSIFSPER